MNIARWLLLFLILPIPSAVSADDWILKSPRPDIAIEGTSVDGELTLTSRDEEGLNGYWEREFPLGEAGWVEFLASRKATGVEYERRSCVVRIEWKGASGESVASPYPVNSDYFGDVVPLAKPDFPKDGNAQGDGWVGVSGRYRVPEKAVSAVVQLHLRWAPGGSVIWKDVSLKAAEPLPPRKVKLAAVHTNLSGSGRTVAENRSLFVPLIEEAASQGADLVVLPELLTCKGVTHDYASVAETIPGATTDFFGALAKEHDCYLVVGMPEKSGILVYNVAVLIGPDGKVVGKYRKVTLPREEIDRGIAPGSEYPVFETRFGIVGLMVCYDVFFPEVARRLAMSGAEVIALPIWGGNPRLAAARCAENGIYLVSSTYTDHSKNWMKSAIWDREGNRLETAEEWNSVIVREVDLSQPNYWYGLGDFQSRIAREAPVWNAE
ncbi:MAG: carbon-nitrogen hydrolase family protein [Verrucomicrobiales bacterium]|nr:carbon-nitrogen hydrolase family protein [Verrucomicrobiales bacterium]